MAVYVTRAIEGRGLGQHYPFVTRDIQTGRIVAATRFYDMTPWDWSTGPAKANQRHGRPDTVSIGATWLAASAQRSPINSEAKLLMLTHAFETWGVWAVRFETDERNSRSRQAIERLGCQLDGILRAFRPQYSVQLTTQPLDGLAGTGVPFIGLESHRPHTPRFESMSQHQQFCLGIDRRPLCRCRQPGCTDADGVGPTVTLVAQAPRPTSPTASCRRSGWLRRYGRFGC